MSDDRQTLAHRLLEHFGTKVDVSESYGEVTAVIASTDVAEICRALRDHMGFRFEQLVDLCGVDYLAYGQAEWETTLATGTGFSRGVQRSDVVAPESQENRFAVVYHLLSITFNERLRVKTFLNGATPVVSSVVDIWNCANWFEREAFDLFGILFDGHPDLRRILTDYGFIGHPFRKDFPLTGQVEMRYDAEKKRVVYQPVSIEPRVLVPKVVREESHHLNQATKKE